MIEAIITIILAIAIAATIYFLLKKAMTLVINAVVGLITLYLLNVFQVLSWFGAPDIGINLVTVLICAFGGLAGALILVLLHLLGIPV
ncbi:sigmaK-factor processing regulatory BofA [Methanoculleus sp. FWC-SCC1]|uniref:SigmaK-factor processing regulatory BofA n=1 Tax=Methanoculleus frigidifontis TaxID=2584085 RepID=A0ABT8M9U1_9EURY|nr:pro-sigmaK processing inhibitor BofA family protein [Methanoculleus sp. FWC-SCC1]MDN7024692.1 sigmaK-factor processing regulatory BofA [Methanoculleus sp. FWC-SCC1]